MLDFEKIHELSFIIFTMEQNVVLDNGFVVNKDNFTEFVQGIYDT